MRRHGGIFFTSLLARRPDAGLAAGCVAGSDQYGRLWTTMKHFRQIPSVWTNTKRFRPLRSGLSTCRSFWLFGPCTLELDSRTSGSRIPDLAPGSVCAASQPAKFLRKFHGFFLLWFCVKFLIQNCVFWFVAPNDSIKHTQTCLHRPSHPAIT